MLKHEFTQHEKDTEGARLVRKMNRDTLIIVAIAFPLAMAIFRHLLARQ